MVLMNDIFLNQDLADEGVENYWLLESGST